MIITAIGFFSLAAILGLTLLSYVLRNKNAPKAFLFTHGLMAATGLVLLIIYSFYSYPRPIESIVLFVIAASGGFVLGIRDLMNKTVPKWLAIGHGLIAVTGFVFLLIFAVR
jgi:hypothetical protein